MKKLCKSATNRQLCGVCAGIAEYFDVDPTVIRVVWALASLAGGSGVLAYIICALIMPDTVDF